MLRTSLRLWLLCLGMLTACSYSLGAYDEEPSAYDRLRDAIDRGDLAEVEWLAKQFPAAVNECPDQSRFLRGDPTPSALSKAVTADDQTMVRLLLKYGASVKPEQDVAPLHLVKSAGMAQILIGAGASLGGSSKSDQWFSTNNTPLHSARSVDIAKVLLAAGAELNCLNSEGQTPLSTAIHGGPRDVVDYLFQQGGKVDPSDVEALTSACRQGELETARKLLDQGVKIGNSEEYGTDTLHAACQSGNPKVVELLLKRGANPSASTRHYPSPAFAAANVPLLLEHEHHDHAGVLKVLKEAGAKLDLTDEEGNTLLHLAACVGNPETARFLLSCGLSVDAKNAQGQTPLHLAAMVAEEHRGFSGDPKHHATVAELLLGYGADPRREVKITKEVQVLAKDGQSFKTTKITDTFTPSRYAARRSKWAPSEGEIDASQCENPERGLGLYLIQGATEEMNAEIAKDVENGNRAREAVGEVLKRFGAE